MPDIRSKWLAFYAEHLEETSKEIFTRVERMIVGTLIISAGAHVSSDEPAIVLFGYLRHGLVGRGVEVKLSKDWQQNILGRYYFHFRDLLHADCCDACREIPIKKASPGQDERGNATRPARSQHLPSCTAPDATRRCAVVRSPCSR
jgi:hypothetical protein